ncbi:hypothetical protein Tco_1290208, partial [Tanacetum coccineum]
MMECKEAKAQWPYHQLKLNMLPQLYVYAQNNIHPITQSTLGKTGITAVVSKPTFSLPPKEMMRSALATLGLVDEKDPSISSIDLIKSSPLRTRYFSSILIVLMMYIVKCLGDIVIAHILFSNLAIKLTTGKKGREPNICYIRYLSFIIEHQLGKDYHNENLKTFKPHHIGGTTFKTPYESEVPFTSHMCKWTNVQPVTQPKEKADKKLKKKKIPSFSEPKTSNVVKKKTPMKQVTETQYVEEPVDATKDHIDEEVMEDYGIKSLGNMSFDEMYEHDLDKGTHERPFDME